MKIIDAIVSAAQAAALYYVKGFPGEDFDASCSWWASERFATDTAGMQLPEEAWELYLETLTEAIGTLRVSPYEFYDRHETCLGQQYGFVQAQETAQKLADTSGVSIWIRGPGMVQGVFKVRYRPREQSLGQHLATASREVIATRDELARASAAHRLAIQRQEQFQLELRELKSSTATV